MKRIVSKGSTLIIKMENVITAAVRAKLVTSQVKTVRLATSQITYNTIMIIPKPV